MIEWEIVSLDRRIFVFPSVLVLFDVILLLGRGFVAFWVCLSLWRQGYLSADLKHRQNSSSAAKPAFQRLSLLATTSAFECEL